MMSSSRKLKLVKGCLGLVVLVGFVGFMIGEAHQHQHHPHHHKAARIRGGGGGVLVVMRKEGSGIENMKQLDLIVNMGKKRKKHRLLLSLKFNFINKRRVPNGPDPIHNRGAAKSRPPGHA